MKQPINRPVDLLVTLIEVTIELLLILEFIKFVLFLKLAHRTIVGHFLIKCEPPGHAGQFNFPDTAHSTYGFIH